MKCTIYNPSPARRIIHNGLAESRAIEIPPRKSVEAELADHVVERLWDLASKNPTTELQVTEAGEAKPVAMKMKVDDSKVGVIKGKAGR